MGSASNVARFKEKVVAPGLRAGMLSRDSSEEGRLALEIRSQDACLKSIETWPSCFRASRERVAQGSALAESSMVAERFPGPRKQFCPIVSCVNPRNRSWVTREASPSRSARREGRVSPEDEAREPSRGLATAYEDLPLRHRGRARCAASTTRCCAHFLSLPRPPVPAPSR